MTKKSLILLVLIISCVYSPLRTSNAAVLPESSKRSILTELKNDKELCQSYSAFVNSAYVENCNSVDYPIEQVNLDEKNSKQFLCLGFYDRIFRLCWLDTLPKTGKSFLPDNSSIFDARVQKLLPANPDDPLKFCESWKNPYPPRYSKIGNFVAEFDEAMKIPTACIRICTNWKGQFDPLCAVLASMDKISIETREKINDPQEKKVLETKTILESKENGKEPSAASGLQKVSQNAKIESETISKSTESKKIEKEQSGPDDDHAKSLEDPSKILPSLKKSHQSEAPNVETQNSPEVKKLDESKKLDPKKPEESEKLEESKKPEEPKKPNESTLEIPKASLRDKEDNVKINPEILEQSKTTNSKQSSQHPEIGAAPDLTNNNGQLEEETANEQDIVDEEPDKNAESPDERVDVISINTQEHSNRENGGGGEASEDANELEPPTMLQPIDEVNESPEFPSEKQEIVARRPGIPNDDDSHFFGYFSVIGVICIAGYVGYHNKQKILAMVVEGRRSRGGRGRRRPSTANYRKLDCTLEEAVTSQCNSNVTHVIY